ncbi:hypothetical protein GCM10027089_41430 [Nocardia thraciensis]
MTDTLTTTAHHRALQAGEVGAGPTVTDDAPPHRLVHPHRCPDARRMNEVPDYRSVSGAHVVAAAGAGPRVPGRINSLDDLWRALPSGRKTVARIPANS